ncbi:MAG: HPr kinase/phosphatase C-terminal domain-containing protein [Pyrinomonadaceae bacterium]|nr:HPr kinase/phosphatase C-terminal domain-containing protein [Pyrinomonadaceae bacterium]
MENGPIIHASCVEINGRGVLICGESGSGKTTLVIELVSRGAKFVADDAVAIFSKDNRKWATATDTTRGAISISPFKVGMIEDVVPDATVSGDCMVELCVELDARLSCGSDPLFDDIPRVYLEKNSVRVMAEMCEKIVNKLLA